VVAMSRTNGYSLISKSELKKNILEYVERLSVVPGSDTTSVWAITHRLNEEWHKERGCSYYHEYIKELPHFFEITETVKELHVEGKLGWAVWDIPGSTIHYYPMVGTKDGKPQNHHKFKRLLPNWVRTEYNSDGVYKTYNRVNCKR